MIIKAQRGRGSKIHLLLDDEYQLTTDAEFWALNFISDGTDITDGEWEELVEKINYRKAFNKCADLLSRRDHSINELRDKLLRTVDEASADKAIDKFIEMGYLDDEKFARALAEHLYDTKHYSDSHVKQELYQRGISRDIINDIVESAENDSVQSVMTIINKKYLNKLNMEGGREKVIDAMVRKGFSYSDIKSALEQIENGE